MCQGLKPVCVLRGVKGTIVMEKKRLPACSLTHSPPFPCLVSTQSSRTVHPSFARGQGRTDGRDGRARRMGSAVLMAWVDGGVMREKQWRSMDGVDGWPGAKHELRRPHVNNTIALSQAPYSGPSNWCSPLEIYSFHAFNGLISLSPLHTHHLYPLRCRPPHLFSFCSLNPC